MIDAETQEHPEANKDGDAPNYEEKAQEIVQSILQEVVNTVAGGRYIKVPSPKGKRFS